MKEIIYEDCNNNIELMNLFNDIRTIYEGVFVAAIDGHQSKISIFDGDIISIQGDIENFLQSQA